MTVVSSKTQATPMGVTCQGVVYIYRVEGYDVVALSRVDLEISAGEWTALVGPSGSGKSTLLALMAGMLRPAAGRLTVGGHDLARPGDALSRNLDVGVVLQGTDHNLLPYLSAAQNIKFAQRGVPRRRRAGLWSPRELLDLVGLDAQAARRTPSRLSPGQRQRLSVAVGAAAGGGLLLADEPTSALDTEARDEVLDALQAVRETGCTVVVVTHDPAVGARADRTVVIRDGRVGAEGRKGEDFLVVGGDGTVHLPPELLEGIAAGSLLRVWRDDNGIHLTPDDGVRDTETGA